MHAVERARARRPQERRRRVRRPGQRQERHRAVAARRAARQGRTVHARDRLAVLHPDAAQGGRQRLRRVQKLFKYFNSSWTPSTTASTCLILDEAHRIRETSVNRYTQAELRTGRPQVDELIAAARVPVFLLDEHQVVRPGEMGTVEDIEHMPPRRWARRSTTIDLDAQFRCGGSEEYVDWVRATARPRAGRADAVDRRRPSFERPGRRLAGRSWRHRSRAAGSTATTAPGWRPATAGRGATRDGRHPGARRRDRRLGPAVEPQGRPAVGGAPPAALWASEPAGFGQVGCVYTAQGFEYDWNGVIIGPDLVWRDGPLGAPSGRRTGTRTSATDTRVTTRSSTAWCATSTRCCSAAECSERASTRRIARRANTYGASSATDGPGKTILCQHRAEDVHPGDHAPVDHQVLARGPHRRAPAAALPRGGTAASPARPAAGSSGPNLLYPSKAPAFGGNCLGADPAPAGP